MSDGPLLQIENLEAFYGDFKALFGISMKVEPGQVVAMIGANGAGKSTLMRCISGMMTTSKSAIRFRGEEVGGSPAFEMLSRGIAMVPEGRKLFPSLSVEENLLIGAHARQGNGYWTLDRVQALFPILRERRHNPGTALSGGQQQMVAIGRALLNQPRVLLCDEISLGLAPKVVKEIYEAVPSISAAGTAIVLVEQDVGLAKSQSNRLYCLLEGRVTLTGASRDISRDAIGEAYFGASHAMD